MDPKVLPVRLEGRFRPAVRAFRTSLSGAELELFDLLCLAGRLGRALPYQRANIGLVAGRKDPRRTLGARLTRVAASTGRTRTNGEWRVAARRLARRLAAAFGRDDGHERFAALGALLGNASIALAPDCRVPTHPPFRAAWDAVVLLFARLYGDRIRPLGPLPWIDPRLLRRLQREARAGARVGREASGRRPGLEGRRLAIDPRLIRVVSRALGRRVVPAYVARYVFYTRPGDYFFPHADDPEFAVNVLVCLDRELPDTAASGSAFVAYRPDGTVERHELVPGGAVAAEARGVIHGREALEPGERVTLLSIAMNYARG